MNIMQVHYHWDAEEPGGIVAMMDELMVGLERRDHKVLLLASDWNSDKLTAHTDRNGRRYSRLNLSPPPQHWWNARAMLGWLLRTPKAAMQIRQLMSTNNIDIAQLHYADPLYLTFAILRQIAGTRYIMTVHGGDILRYDALPAFGRWACRRIINNAATVVAVSKSLAEETKKKFPRLAKIQVVRNGFDHRPEESLTRQELYQLHKSDLPSDYAVVVGNCRPCKGIDVAIRAWSILSRRRLDLPLLIVGGGPDLGQMRKMVEGYGLSSRIQFVGAVPRKVAIAYSAHAKFQIIPSRNEGQGIVILEAALVGTPIICSDIAPFLEMVKDEVSAFVFESGDETSLADRVYSALEDPGKAKRLAASLKQSVAREFSVAVMLDEYEKVYTSVCDH